MKIKNKDIAEAIHKTPSAITYSKRTNPDEFEIMKLGVICKKANLDEDKLLHLLKLAKGLLDE